MAYIEPLLPVAEGLLSRVVGGAASKVASSVAEKGVSGIAKQAASSVGKQAVSAVANTAANNFHPISNSEPEAPPPLATETAGQTNLSQAQFGGSA